MGRFQRFIGSLGPGLLWAAAAIGVSHLVQSTRAGAAFGFGLLWLIVAANLLKYPFFEFATRYTVATGESLLHGYRRQGRWMLLLYLAITFLTMFALMGAVTTVTAGLCASVLGWLSPFGWSLLLLALSALVVLIGRYRLLDSLIKVIIVILTLSTIVAVASAFSAGYHPDPAHTRSFSWSYADIVFLLAFVGWMPTAIDVSVWQSYWVVARARQQGSMPAMRPAMRDFNIGYIGTSVLSIGFLSLGALVMYGSGQQFPAGSVGFAGSLIELYTRSIGAWAFVPIAVAAITTMFSTVLTCLDAYPRVLFPAFWLMGKGEEKEQKKSTHLFWLALVLAGTVVTLYYFAERLTFMVDLATTLSFVTAPVLGLMNYRVMYGRNVPANKKPRPWLKLLSWAGLAFLSAFALVFIVWRFFISA